MNFQSSVILRRIQGIPFPNTTLCRSYQFAADTRSLRKKGEVIEPVILRLAPLIFTELCRESFRLPDPLALHLVEALLPQSLNSEPGFAKRLKRCNPKWFE